MKMTSTELTYDGIEIEKTITTFTENVIKAAEQTIGYLKSSTKKPQVPWWNNKIKKSISMKNKALKTFLKTRSPEDHIKLKELRAKTRFLVKSYKTLSWRNFTSNIGTQVDPHIMWNKIRSLQGRKKHNNIYLITNSSLNTDPSSIADYLGKHFEKNSSNEMYSHQFLRENLNKPPPQPSLISPQDTLQSHLNCPITIEEILQALKNVPARVPDQTIFLIALFKTFPSTRSKYFLKSITPSGIIMYSHKVGETV